MLCKNCGEDLDPSKMVPRPDDPSRQVCAECEADMSDALADARDAKNDIDDVNDAVDDVRDALDAAAEVRDALNDTETIRKRKRVRNYR